jgi:phosphoribosylaminoimidazole-succinocarboxamide synthase
MSRATYERGAREIAAAHAIIMADAKFEFGRDDQGRLSLIDEVLTSDNFRLYRPGCDKQRDCLEAERGRCRWHGGAPAPCLPSELLRTMSARYLEVLRRLAGCDLIVRCDCSAWPRTKAPAFAGHRDLVRQHTK